MKWLSAIEIKFLRVAVVFLAISIHIYQRGASKRREKYANEKGASVLRDNSSIPNVENITIEYLKSNPIEIKGSFYWWFTLEHSVIINDLGIVDSTLGIGLIPWKEIAGAYVKCIGNGNFICLELSNPEYWSNKFPSKDQKTLSKLKSRGFSVVNVNLTGMKVDLGEILAVILKVSSGAQIATEG
jgi:hypothetical protein